jgi:hypothetical protein
MGPYPEGCAWVRVEHLQPSQAKGLGKIPV